MFCFGKDADVELSSDQSTQSVGCVESSSAEEREIPHCCFVVRDEREDVMRESTLRLSRAKREQAW